MSDQFNDDELDRQVVTVEMVKQDSQKAADALKRLYYIIHPEVSASDPAIEEVFDSWTMEAGSAEVVYKKDGLKTTWQQVETFAREVNRGLSMKQVNRNVPGLTSAFRVVDPSMGYGPAEAKLFYSAGNKYSEYRSGVRYLEQELSAMQQLAEKERGTNITHIVQTYSLGK
jgi:hypothetical protein